MNKFFSFVKSTFSKKNNILFFILSLIVSMTATISLSAMKINTEKEFADYQNFPTNYSYLMGLDSNYKNTLNEDFKNLKYTTIRTTTSSKLTINMEMENRKFVFVGVNSNFENFPLPNFSTNVTMTSIQKQNIITGSSFTNSDLEAKTKTIVMNQLDLLDMNYQGEDIYINGIAFKLKGILSSQSSMKRYRGTDKLYIPVYLPYTTLLELLNGKDNFSYNCVIETKGYRFTKYEKEEGPILQSKYLLDNYKDVLNKQSQNRLIIILGSLFLLSFVATFIVSYIMVRNKHFEIGIKRAIGASKEDIVFEFLSEFTLVTFLSVISGFVLGICVTIMINIKDCFILCSPIIIFNFSIIVLSLSIYFLFVFLASMTSILVGAKMNIASIIVEER